VDVQYHVGGVISDCGVWVSGQIIELLICGGLRFFSRLSLFLCDVVEWHQNGLIYLSCVVQRGSGDFLDCETLLGREWGCFILLCILSLGAVDGRDIPGQSMLRMLGGVILKFA
jgi:hypothetical protein